MAKNKKCLLSQKDYRIIVQAINQQEQDILSLEGFAGELQHLAKSLRRQLEVIAITTVGAAPRSRKS